MVIFAAALTASLFANVSTARTSFLGGVHFDAGLPQGEWNDKVGDDAFGGSAQIFYSPDSSPLAIGLEMGWSNYGSESRREPFAPNIPDVTVRVEHWNNIVQGFLVLRGQVPGGPLRAYGDALLGFNYLYTESKVTDEDHGHHDVASTTNQDDTALAFGLGGGLMAPVWHSSRESKGIEEVSIDAGARYIWGGKAEYLKEGSIRQEDGRVVFDTMESRTDETRLHVGVTARF